MGWVLAKTLGWVGQELERGDRRGLRKLLADTLTYRLFDRAMLVAVVYPFLLLFLFWVVTGQDARLGAAVVIPSDERVWIRVVALCLIALVIASPALGKPAAASRKRFFQSVSGLLPLIAVAGAVVFAVAFAVTVTVAVGVALGFAVTVAFAVAVARAGAGAVAVAATGVGAGAVAGPGGVLAGAVAVAFALASVAAANRLHSAGRDMLAVGAFVAGITFVILAALSLIDMSAIGPERLGIFLFLAVLPLLNAIFDTFSYAVTFAATQRGLRAGRWAVLLGALDLAVACVLFLALGATIVLVVGGMNRIAGVQFADLGGILAQIGNWREYWWLYAMAFSTIVPTALHIGIASFSLQAWIPYRWRQWLWGLIEREEGDLLAATFAPLLLGTLWMLCLLGPPALLGGILWYWAGPALQMAGAAYQDWLISVAMCSGGI